MNSSNVSQYPAALYSAVSEIGYRQERFTGEVLRSDFRVRPAHRRNRFEGLRGRFGTRASRSRPAASGRMPASRSHSHRHASAH